MKKLEKAQIYFLIGSFIFVLLLTLIVQNPQETSLAEQSTIKYTVVIDAGHGGIDPGGIGIATKVKEADLNLIISKKLKTLLDASGIQVILTREDKNGLYGIYTKNYKKDDMAKRKNIIDSANPDVVVSIHMNRFTNKSLRGAQTFYNEGNILGEKLATCVQEEFKNQLEKYYSDMQDMEFTIQEGKLYMLQTRNGKRTAAAAVRIAVELAEDKIISKEEAIMRVKANSIGRCASIFAKISNSFLLLVSYSSK